MRTLVVGLLAVVLVAGCTEPRDSRHGGASGGGGGTVAGTGGNSVAGSGGRGGAGGQLAATGGSTIGAAGMGGGGASATGGSSSVGGAGGGSAASGGRTGSGGAASGGMPGGATGGTGTGSGGVGASGGMIAGSGGTGTGGMGTGGSGTGGSGTGGSGTGGTSAACQVNATQCVGASIATCGNSGQWGAATACPARQSCTGPSGTARCTCVADAVCTSVGNTCAGMTTLAACMQDAQQCFYQASSSPCTNGACSGAAGAASCCTNACTMGTAQCMSGKSLQACTMATSGCTALSTSACATGTVCERHAPACEDPNWAAWPMPNAATEVNAASYKDNGNGTVTDLVTGLMWEKAPSVDTYIWSAAVTHCPQMTLGGYSDWRLPTFMELFSLVDFSASFPSINTTYFTNMTGGLYWTATPVSGQTNFAWEVNFNNGVGNADATIGTNPVICVR